MPITFRNPPINEVVISTYFNPPLSDLRSEHVGLFWEKIKSEFPVVRQQPLVGIGPTVGAANEVFPMPRYWFIASDGINLIQIQQNAFMFNWRRGGDEYPRFHRNIKPTFDRYYGLFSEFIRGEISNEDLAIDLCELAYVNTLERCEFWAGPQETMNVIPSFSVLAPGINFSGSPEFNCNYAYRVADDLHLNIGIRSGVKAQEQNIPILIFEIKASGRVGQRTKPGTDEWFERAHDAILGCFVGMTSTDIQNRFWEPVEETQ